MTRPTPYDKSYDDLGVFFLKAGEPCLGKEIVGMAEETKLLKEEIIELTDEIATPPQNDDEIIELTDEITAPPQNDDDIIELVAEVDKSEPKGPADRAGSATEWNPDMAAIFDMTAESEETKAFKPASTVLPDGDIMIGDDIDVEMDFDEGTQDDFVNSMGMDLETDSAISQVPEEPETLTGTAADEAAPITLDAISSDQIEAAIERVIMKILPEKIDGILSTAIEKALAREIEKIKALLLEDSSGNGV